MKKSVRFGLIVLFAMLVHSCTIGGDYGVQYLAKNLESSEITVKSIVADKYLGYKNAELYDYITIPAGQTRLLYNANNLKDDTLPKDFFKSFDVYYNFVLVRSISPGEFNFTKVKSFHATNVYGPDYTIEMQLSDLDRSNYASYLTPVVTLKTATSFSISVTWPKLQRSGADATGVFYRARLVSSKGVWTPWTPLGQSDIDATEANFDGLESDSDYDVHVYYGGNQVGLGEIPKATFRTLAVSQDPAAAQNLAAAQAGIVGNWTGTRICPWTSPILVNFVFRSDGTYGSSAVTSSEGPALYYGTDQDSSEKQYILNYFGPSGASGTIQIVFDTGPASGTIKDINVSANSLTFSVLHLNQYGPISFSLLRKN